MKKVAAVIVLLLMTVGFAEVIMQNKLLLEWDLVTTDVNGAPEIVTAYDVGIFAPSSDIAIMTKRVVSPPTFPVDATELFAGLPDGVYVCKARAVDRAGNVSAWSTETDRIVFDNTPPSAPAGCRCATGK